VLALRFCISSSPSCSACTASTAAPFEALPLFRRRSTNGSPLHAVVVPLVILAGGDALPLLTMSDGAFFSGLPDERNYYVVGHDLGLSQFRPLSPQISAKMDLGRFPLPPSGAERDISARTLCGSRVVFRVTNCSSPSMHFITVGRVNDCVEGILPSIKRFEYCWSFAPRAKDETFRLNFHASSGFACHPCTFRTPESAAKLALVASPSTGQPQR